MIAPPAPQDLQVRARSLVYRAVRAGDLIRQACVVCGTEPAEGHHEDYDRPLDVVWLCRLHHSWRHKYGESVETMRAEWAA